MSKFANKIIDDAAQIFTGVARVSQGARQEFETLLQAHVEARIAEAGFVSRVEFEALQDEVAALRAELEALKS